MTRKLEIGIGKVGDKMGFYYACPYFLNESKNGTTITCEDTIRYFGKNARGYARKYCRRDDNWKNCKFAKRLNHLYEAGEGPDTDDIKQAAEHEMKKMLTQLARYKSRCEKLERENRATRHLAEKQMEMRAEAELRLNTANTRARLMEECLAYEMSKVAPAAEIIVDANRATLFGNDHAVRWELVNPDDPDDRRLRMVLNKKKIAK